MHINKQTNHLNKPLCFNLNFCIKVVSDLARKSNLIGTFLGGFLDDCDFCLFDFVQLLSFKLLVQYLHLTRYKSLHLFFSCSVNVALVPQVQVFLRTKESVTSLLNYGRKVGNHLKKTYQAPALRPQFGDFHFFYCVFTPVFHSNKRKRQLLHYVHIFL